MKKWIAMLLVLLFVCNFAACAKEKARETLTAQKMQDALKEHDYEQVGLDDDLAESFLMANDISLGKYYTCVSGEKTGDGTTTEAKVFLLKYADEKAAGKVFEALKQITQDDGCFLTKENFSGGKKYTGTFYEANGITAVVLIQVDNMVIFAAEYWRFSVTEEKYDFDLMKIIKELGY